MSKARQDKVNYFQDVWFDYVIEVNEYREYTEIVGEKDGVVQNVRVYNSGKYYIR